MGKYFLNPRMLVTTVAMLIVCISMSSCESLRKKFTRQKKQDLSQSPEFQPVLEPQEYLAPENDPAFNYNQHYSLIKAWYKDLWRGVDEKNSDVTAKYSLKQILDHIEQMKPLLKPEKATELDQLENLLKYYKDALEQSRVQRNYSRIQSDLRAFDRMLRARFRGDVVGKDFIGR